MTAHGLEKTLPSHFYLSDEIYVLERERIFARDWYCVGRETDVPGPGDHLVLDVVGESVLLVRNPLGNLRAFYNVCRHRGARLCGPAVPGNAAPGGVINGKRIRCPYHSWYYDLDGRLTGAPYMATVPGFDSAEFSLYPVGVECWGGFVFVNLTPADAPPLADMLGGAPERTVRYPLAELKAARTIRYEVAANWKVIAENYNECYHCGGVHPELCDIVPAFRQRGGEGLDWDRGIPHRDGATTFTWTGTTARAAFPALNADERERHKGELIYPNLFISLACDHAAAFLLYPKGPALTVIDCLFLFAPDEMTKPDFDPSNAVDFWDLVNRQDWAICESVQQGMGARPHAHGYYAPMEDCSLDMRRYVERRLGISAG